MLPTPCRDRKNQPASPPHGPAVGNCCPGASNERPGDHPEPTLRQALSAITRKLGLTYTLGKEDVLLQPIPALGGWAAVDRVRNSRPWTCWPAPPAEYQRRAEGSDHPHRLDNNLAATKGATLAVRTEVDKEVARTVLASRATPGMLDALEQSPGRRRRSVPVGRDPGGGAEGDAGPQPARQAVHRPLQTASTCAGAGDLRKRAGVDFIIDAGAIQKVPVEFRTVKVFCDTRPGRPGAGRPWRGFTGLEFQWWTRASGSPTPPRPSPRRRGRSQDPVV